MPGHRITTGTVALLAVAALALPGPARAGALGVRNWEPTGTAVDGAGGDPAGPTSGDGWENRARFDYSGRALPAPRVLGDAAAKPRR